jgi:hypothetical protein
MPSAMVHETKELDASVLASRELGNDSEAMEPDTGSEVQAIICLPRHFFLDFCFLDFE